MKAENIIGPVSMNMKSERSYYGIRFTTQFDGMFAIVSRTLKELRNWSKENSLTEEGPYFLRYYHCDMKSIMDIEVGLISSTEVSASGHIGKGVLPNGKYATLNYRGNGLRANQALMKWAKDNHIIFDPLKDNTLESYVCRYEAYLTDYRLEPRKLLWDIELAIKVKE